MAAAATSAAQIRVKLSSPMRIVNAHTCSVCGILYYLVDSIVPMNRRRNTMSCAAHDEIYTEQVFNEKMNRTAFFWWIFRMIVIWRLNTIHPTHQLAPARTSSQPSLRGSFILCIWFTQSSIKQLIVRFVGQLNWHDCGITRPLNINTSCLRLLHNCW